MSEVGWSWDPSLYAGSAAYYVRGRVPYTQELVGRLVAELTLDGSGRLLDVGRGPGSLTLLLAPMFEHATGLDADPHMLVEAERQAAAAGIANVDWVNLRAEDMAADLGPFRVATLAQSFHWMDRARVARLLHGALGIDGVLVHLHATTHEGIDSDVPLPLPRPPRREIDELVKGFLGTRRRAGQGTLPEVSITEADRGRYEAEKYRAAGFNRPTRIEVPGPVVVRSADDIVASMFSLSVRHRTSSVTVAPPSRRNFATFSWRSVPWGGSASRCAILRSTSGMSSRHGHHCCHEPPGHRGAAFRRERT